MSLAELLRDVAASYQILDEDRYRFQVIAYQRAADGIEKLSSEVKDYYDENKLDEIPGVGKSISEHLKELFSTGSSKHFDDMIGKLPKAVFKLMKVPGLGPKKAFRLANEFKLSEKSPLADLLSYAKKGKIAELDGFGEESQKDIVEAITEYQVKPPERVLIDVADEIATELVQWLKEVPGVESVDALGSLRRKASTVGDIDISVASHESTPVFDKLVTYPRIYRVIERGEHSCSILLPGNIQIDVMVQPPQAYGSLLQHFTGSKHHNVALREFALKKGLSLSEYGIKSVEPEFSKKHSDRFNKELNLYQFSKESDFYEALGLSYIPPELRDDSGEIQAALSNSLPQLVELENIKGDLQIHSDFDIETSHDVGQSSMKDVALQAMDLNYEYIAFTEHNPSQKGHSPNQMIHLLEKKRETVAKLNFELVKIVKNRNKTKSTRAFKVFNSLEVDILPTGRLAVPERALEVLDFALVSIHSSFKQSKAVATKRVLEALSFPQVKIFAHPTGRLLNKRESVNLDWDQIFDFALKNDKWIEINADPHRLDLPDVLVKEAVKHGVKMTLGTDSHHLGGMQNMKYGVWVARRGWAKKEDIINTRSLTDFERMIR